MIDLHCHVLQGVDDGPETLEGALDLLRCAAEAGTTTMVATPHVSARYHGNSRTTIEDSVNRLSEEAAAAGIPVTLHVGAEVSLSHCDVVGQDVGRELRLAESPYRLVELPFVTTPDMVTMLFFAHHWVQPVVIAHPERCTAFQEDPELLEGLVDRGALVQVTASSFGGRFGSTVQRTSWDMLERGLVHVVASDCHDLRSRGPQLRDPLEDAGLGTLVGALCVDGPAAVLAGRRPEPAPSIPTPRAVRRSRLRSRVLGRRR